MTNSEAEVMLEALKLKAMANSYREIMKSHSSTSMTIEEIITHMCLAQKEENRHKSFMRLKRAAKFKHDAQPEDITWGVSRGFEKTKLRTLLLPDWVARTENLLISGPSGTGKSWLSCAIGQSLIRHGTTVKYVRTNLILDELRVAHIDGTIARKRRALLRPELLILDDFGIAPITESEKEDLFEILEARTNVGSTLMAGQLSPSEWYDYLSAGHLADAIMDRIIQRSHSIELKGESMRQKLLD